MTRGKKFRKSDMAILMDSARANLKALDRWLNQVAWDQLACRLIGHTTPHQPAGDKAFICRRCKLGLGRVLC